MSVNVQLSITTAQVITAPTTILLPEQPNIDRLAVTLDVTAASGTTPSMSAQLEGLDPTTNKWYLIRAFAAKTAVATETISVGHPNDTTFPVRSMRINVTAVTGTTPSFTVSIGANTRVI